MDVTHFDLPASRERFALATPDYARAIRLSRWFLPAQTARTVPLRPAEGGSPGRCRVGWSRPAMAGNSLALRAISMPEGKVFDCPSPLLPRRQPSNYRAATAGSQRDTLRLNERRYSWLSAMGGSSALLGRMVSEFEARSRVFPSSAECRGVDTGVGSFMRPRMPLELKEWARSRGLALGDGDSV